MEKNKKLLFVIGVVILSISIFIYLNLKVEVTKYKIVSENLPEGFNNFKIVQLSDFHGEGIGEDNKIIVDKINKINPDIVVMTGDMINESMDNIDEIKWVIKGFQNRYPIYYIDGNHEQIAELISKSNYNVYISELESLGVIILKNKTVEINRGNESINISGIDIPLDNATALYVDGNELDDEYVKNILPETNDNNFELLLAHNPRFIDQYSKWGADVVLSGHLHGGIVRIPFIGVGILSTESKLFPKYDAGKFKVKDSIMIVNRGIGTSSLKFRVFNKPEIGEIILKSK